MSCKEEIHMEEWKEYNISDLSIMRNGRKRPTISGEFPVFGGNGIIDKVSTNNAEDVIIIGRVGAYCGNVYYCKNKCWISDNAIAVYANDKIEIEYLFYLFSILDLHHSHIGGAQPLMTQDIIGGFKVKIPSKLIQRRIVNILKSLDDKIELNKKINENLEAQASALFKRWFIDFDFPNPNNENKPYRSSGGKMIESEMGMIPEGWKVGKLGDIVNISSGKRPIYKQNHLDKDNTIPIIGASCIMGYTNSALFNDKLLITGRVGTHGVIQRVNFPSWPSDNTLIIKSEYYEFSNQILRRIDYKNMNRGSTQPLITQTDLNNTQIIIPNKRVMMLYEKNSNALMNSYENNLNENAHLSEIRDSLLPKLMNNKIKLENL